MTDPIYTFVKGEGWVINPAPTHTFKCGTVCRLEFRKPLVGEMYDHGSEWAFRTTDNPDIKAWLNHLRGSNFSYGSMMRQFNNDHYGDGCYVVFVPV